MAIEIKIEEITPARAEEYLKTGILKRNVSDRVVGSNATLMARGLWEPYPPIEFDAEDRLINGTHRLLGVVKAGVSVKMAVVRGVTPEMGAVLDSAIRVRSMQQLMKMYRPKVDYRNNRAAALGVCTWLLTGTPQRIGSLKEYDLWIKPFRAGIDWICATKLTTTAVTRPAGVLGALAFAHRTDPDGIDRFGAQLRDGLRLTAGAPALVLRNHLTQKPPGRMGGGSYKIIVARQVLNAARAAIQNERMLRVSSDDGGRQFFMEAYKRAQKIAIEAV